MDTVIKEENLIATSLIQTPEGLIHMISNEYSDASAELAVGSPLIEEGSNIKRKSEITGKTITSLLRAGGASIATDIEDNLILAALKNLIAVVDSIEFEAKSENVSIEKDSYKSCLNFLVAALESVSLSAESINLKANKIELNSQELTFKSPKIHFGVDTSLQEDKNFNGEEDVDINGVDIPLTLNRFKCWWDSEVAPAFESVLNDLADKFNNHNHPLSTSASSLIPPINSPGQGLTDFDKKLENASIASKLSAAKTVTVL